MKNISPTTNIYVLNKKFHNCSENKNKSSSETNRTTLSGLIKSSEDNNYGKKFYNKIINTILYSKYNVLPQEHDMILLENVLQSKYCHDLAVFKEKILFNYNEEFLKRFYTQEESILRIPKFVTYYKNYLMFFCKPIFSELDLNDLIQAYSERKAQIFYQNNYKDDIPKEEKENLPLFTIFTPKIRKLISNNNSLSNLTVIFPSLNNSNISSVESSMIKIINDLTLKKNPIKKNVNMNINNINNNIKKKENNNNTLSNREKINNKNILMKKENNNTLIVKEKISKNFKASSPDCTKTNVLGKNLFFIYNQNFKKVISNHNHTKTSTNLNQFIEKVILDNGNSKKSFSKKSVSKTKVLYNKKRSRNLIISNPLLSNLGIYTYRNEKNNKPKFSLNSIHNTINSMLSPGKKTRCITERNNQNLIKAIKQVENNENKKIKKNLSRNINRNSFSNCKIPFSTMLLTGKNYINNFNDFILKTDYYNNGMKIRNNSNQKVKINNKVISNKGINQIKQCIQSQKKKFKK